MLHSGRRERHTKVARGVTFLQYHGHIRLAGQT